MTIISSVGGRTRSGVGNIIVVHEKRFCPSSGDQFHVITCVRRDYIILSATVRWLESSFKLL